MAAARADASLVRLPSVAERASAPAASTSAGAAASSSAAGDDGRREAAICAAMSVLLQATGLSDLPAARVGAAVSVLLDGTAAAAAQSRRADRDRRGALVFCAHRASVKAAADTLPDWRAGMLIGRSSRFQGARTTTLPLRGQYTMGIDESSLAHAAAFASVPEVAALLRHDGEGDCVLGDRTPAPVGRGPGRIANGLMRVSRGDRAFASTGLVALRVRSVFGACAPVGLRTPAVPFRGGVAFVRLRISGIIHTPRFVRERARAEREQRAAEGATVGGGEER